MSAVSGTARRIRTHQQPMSVQKGTSWSAERGSIHNLPGLFIRSCMKRRLDSGGVRVERARLAGGEQHVAPSERRIACSRAHGSRSGQAGPEAVMW